MSRPALQRLLAPRSIALIGGAWADAVQAASAVIGFRGELWRVHPRRADAGEPGYYRDVDGLPAAPDAAFIAAPNREVPAIVSALARRGAGGFVCFAAGFSETATAEGTELTQRLLDAAQHLPFFGPNCYGFINFFDAVALWPDQLVRQQPRRGIALICQSGTLALNVLFNDRSLPLGYVLTVGNQTRLAAEDLLDALADDERVSSFGLYLEGVRNMRRFAAAAEKARRAGKPIALLKAGRTAAAAATVHSHTGALAGADTAFDAFCEQAGIARCETLSTLCETLKIFHVRGPLPGRRLLAMGASGGDMALAADSARQLGLQFPTVPTPVKQALQELLTSRVHIANPFDFHTHIWFDAARQQRLFEIVRDAGYDAVAFMIDFPPASAADRSAYANIVERFCTAFEGAATRAAVVSSLPESLPAAVRERCLDAGVAPLQGQREALEALDLAGAVGETWQSQRPVPQLRLSRAGGGPVHSLAEHEAKSALAAFGVPVPRAAVVDAADVGRAASALGFPVALKATAAGLEHKSEVGGVILNVRDEAQAEAGARRLAALSSQVLVEEMVSDAVAEILVGITVDPQFGQLLVLGAGGVFTELVRDSTALLPPFDAPAIAAALRRLRIWRVLEGFRGAPAADVEALIACVQSCTRFGESHAQRLVELDLNPVIVRPRGRGAVAVDALVRMVEG
ncbi:MAG: acetate--CoA ligase family protein [Gammaproteobacteria bacterium]|nr:acetate--CoA ligase family protein [Gammaproteobacteria bacterium]